MVVVIVVVVLLVMLLVTTLLGPLGFGVTVAAIAAVVATVPMERSPSSTSIGAIASISHIRKVIGVDMDEEDVTVVATAPRLLFRTPCLFSKTSLVVPLLTGAAAAAADEPAAAVSPVPVIVKPLLCNGDAVSKQTSNNVADDVPPLLCSRRNSFKSIQLAPILSLSFRGKLNTRVSFSSTM